nr:hypothetical protein [Tanacetum cinerariifolium]
MKIETLSRTCSTIMKTCDHWVNRCEARRMVISWSSRNGDRRMVNSTSRNDSARNRSSKDARTDNEDNVLVHEENEIIEHDAEVNMFGINNNVPFDNIDITIQLPWEVLAGGDVDMVHVDGFDSETGCEDEVGFKRRKKLKELIRGMENRVLNDIAGMKYSFYR